MKISIVGAGFSGLSLAYFLLKKGFEVEIHEASSGPGGLIQTIQTDRGLVETAATSILLTSDLEELAKDIKINYITPKKKSRKKYISINHSPKRMPLRFIDIFSLLKGIFNILFNKIKTSPRKGESLADWADRVFNKSIRQKLVSPAMLGIYADSSENLSATLVLRKVFSPKKKKKSKGPVNFDGGMGSFIKALEKYLLEKGVSIQYNSKINLINKPKNPYVIATSFKQAIDLNLELPKLPLKSMSSATLFFDGIPPLEGFGTLFPIEEGLNSQGVLFNTSMFEKRTNTGYSETWILSEKTKLSEEQLLELILKDRSQVFKSTERPKDFILHHWQDAFPLYGLELESLLSKGWQLPKSVYLTGNYLGNLGLSGIIEQNNRLSKKMAMELL